MDDRLFVVAVWASFVAGTGCSTVPVGGSQEWSTAPLTVTTASVDTPTHHPTGRGLPLETALVQPLQTVSTSVPANHERITLVVDIDETLCVTDYNSVLWGIGSDDSRPLAGCVTVMRELASDYDILYLTARPDSVRGKTQRWLASKGFPQGRIVTSPTVGDFILQSDFKKNMLRRIGGGQKGMLIGIGDKAADGEAYRTNRMLSVVVNPWSTHRYHRNDVVLTNWPALGR